MKKLVTLAVLLISLFAFTAMATAKTVKVPTQFKTIQAAVNSPLVKSGDVIQVAAGQYAGASFAKANKKLTITGTVVKKVNKTFIISGPAIYGAKAGFYFGGKGAGTTIQNLVFTVEFPVYSAKPTAAISVLNCEMRTPVQGVTNWEGSGWTIQGNVIKNLKTLKANGVDAAGGIGILIANMTATSAANDNKILENQILGAVKIFSGAVPSAVSGITLFADFREDVSGPILRNTVKGNKISLTKPAAIENLHGIGLNQASIVPSTTLVIKKNTVAGNIFPLPNNQMTRVECYPAALKDVNTINVPRRTMEDAAPTVEATSDALVNPL